LERRESCRCVCTLPKLDKFDLKQNQNNLQFRMNISVLGKQDFNNQISIMMPVFITIYIHFQNRLQTRLKPCAVSSSSLLLLPTNRTIYLLSMTRIVIDLSMDTAESENCTPILFVVIKVPFAGLKLG